MALAHYSLPVAGSFNRLFYWHNEAVDLFFCLSGFTLALVYSRQPRTRDGFRNYLVARLARIYPLYIATLLWVALIRLPVSSIYPFNVAIRDFVAQVAAVNSWPIIGSGVHWNIPSWSISIEVFCYLFIFPVLWFAHTTAKPWVAVSLIGLCAVASYIAVTRYMDWHISEPGHYHAEHWSAYVVNTVRGVAGFFAGWMVCSIYLGKSGLNTLAAMSTGLTALAMIGVIAASAAIGINKSYIIFLFPLLILGLANGNSLVANGLSGRLTHRLGTYSYSVYLLHIPVKTTVDILITKYGIQFSSASYSVILVGALVASSSLSFHYFEVPWRRMIRRWFQAPASSRKLVTLQDFGRDWPALLASLVLLLATAHMASNIMRSIAPGKELLNEYAYLRVFTEGWSNYEGSHIWGVGKTSVIEISLQETKTLMQVDLRGLAFVTPAHPRKTTAIFVNGVVASIIEATSETPAFMCSLNIPKGVRTLKILFQSDDPVSPRSQGMSDDSRELSIQVESLKVRAKLLHAPATNSRTEVAEQSGCASAKLRR